MENTNNNVRSRVWFCTAYAHMDELFAEAQHVLPNLNGFITAYHDKDVKEDGSPKEAHYHIMISNNNAVCYNTIYKIFKNTMDRFTEDTNFKVDEMKGSWGQASAYMLHNDIKSIEAGKHQYDESCIKAYKGELHKTPERNAGQADTEPAMALMMCIAAGYSFAECVIQFGAFAIFNYKKIAEGLIQDCPAMAGTIYRPKHTYDELMDILSCEKVSRETADYVEDFQPRGENIKALKEAEEYKADRAWEKWEHLNQAYEDTQADTNSAHYGHTDEILYKRAEKAKADYAQHNAQKCVDDPDENHVPKTTTTAYHDDEEDEFCPDDVTQHESDDLEADAQEEIEKVTDQLQMYYNISLPADVVKGVVVKMFYEENYTTESCINALKEISGQQ